MTFLIAEMSNAHNGSVEKAKELIIAAKDAGADAVKGQAFEAKNLVGLGSMSEAFYKKVSLNYQEYLALINFGHSNKIPVFFTLLSNRFSRLGLSQRYRKIHAARYQNTTSSSIRACDNKESFISINRVRKVGLKHANILYATPYLSSIDLEGYYEVRNFYNRDVGISHHGHGFQDIIDLSEKETLPVVEKHIFLDEIWFDGVLYRDCIHGLKVHEFKDLAEALKK